MQRGLEIEKQYPDFTLLAQVFHLTLRLEDENGNHVENLMLRVERMFNTMIAQGGGETSLINGLVEQLNPLVDQITSLNGS